MSTLLESVSSVVSLNDVYQFSMLLLTSTAVTLALLCLHALLTTHKPTTASKNNEATHRSQLQFSVKQISHELREPLRGMKHMAQFLEEEYSHSLDTNGRLYLTTLTNNAERMNRLLESLIEFADKGLYQLNIQSVDTGTAIREVIDEIQHIEPHISIHFHGPFPCVNADYTAFQQIIRNLLCNAIKHSNTQDIYLGYSITEAAFYIRDTGSGIKQHNLSKIFMLYQSAQNNNYNKDLGIGLTIVKCLLESQGGNIWVDSIEGEGTTFWFTLNCVPFIDENADEVIFRKAKGF